MNRYSSFCSSHLQIHLLCQFPNFSWFPRNSDKWKLSFPVFLQQFLPRASSFPSCHHIWMIIRPYTFCSIYFLTYICVIDSVNKCKNKWILDSMNKCKNKWIIDSLNKFKNKWIVDSENKHMNKWIIESLSKGKNKWIVVDSIN